MHRALRQERLLPKLGIVRRRGCHGQRETASHAIIRGGGLVRLGRRVTEKQVKGGHGKTPEEGGRAETVSIATTTLAVSTSDRTRGLRE